MKTPAVRFILRVAPAILALQAVGCVPYQTYEAMKNERDRLKTANDDLIVKYNKAIQEIMKLEGFRSQVAAANEVSATQQRLISDLQAKLNKLEKFDSKSIDNGGLDPAVQVSKDKSELEISDEVLFASGEATLRSAEAKRILDTVIAFFKSKYPDQIIHISGHTDTDPILKSRWGTNQRLAYERAYTVFGYFKDKGIDERQMVIHSFAYLRPAVDGDTKEAKAKNRRVSFGVSEAVKL